MKGYIKYKPVSYDIKNIKCVGESKNVEYQHAFKVVTNLKQIYKFYVSLLVSTEKKTCRRYTKDKQEEI